MYQQETIEFAKHEESQANKFNYRLDKSVDDSNRSRDIYQRDYARILYSSSFRRLQGKMQLLGVDDTSFHRNRLTHSLEVAQIARSIANELQLASPVVCEACSLAHDIGNPPFGHSGEITLNTLSNAIGGYEGNAQVIRILRTLEKKYPNSKGLNLTVRTLLGLTKYFYLRTDNPKKFLYAEDFEVLNNELLAQNVKIRRTIDVQIMDLSDEIAYAAHDLEDSLSQGFMSISEVLYEFQIHEKYFAVHEMLRSIVMEVQKYVGSSTGLKSSEEYSSILRRELTSKIVYTLVSDIGVVNTAPNVQELGFKNYALLSEGLKKLVFKSLLRKRDIQLYEKLGDKVIKGLFDVYADQSFNSGGLLLPVEYRNFNNDGAITHRSIIDYISGMMDAFAISEYKKYYGKNSLENLYPELPSTPI